jgi:hypothetical protein
MFYTTAMTRVRLGEERDSMTEKQNFLNYYRFMAYDHEPPAPGPFGEQILQFAQVDTCICERPMGKTGYDCFSVHWTDGHYTVGQIPIISDIKNWQEGLKIPNVEKVDWTPALRSVESIDRDNAIVTFTTMMGPFERATSLTSFEDCLYNCAAEPELFSEIIAAIADYKVKLIHKICELVNPDSVWFHDDYGSNQSTLMSPVLWRKTIKPHIKRIFDACKEHDLIIVHHSCGRVETLVPDMIENGAHAWEGQKTCNDIDAVRKNYGDRIRLILPDYLPVLDMAEIEAMAPPHMDTADNKPYAEPPKFLYD